MGSYDVRFWDTKKIADNASGGRYRVRWAVNGQENCKSFKNKTLADGFLDNLKDAARDRHVAVARIEHGAVSANEPVLSGAHGQLAGVPHSLQNLAPFSVVPQFPQNFFAACAAARG